MSVVSFWRKLAPVIVVTAVLLIAANGAAQAPATAQPAAEFTAHFETYRSIGSDCPVAVTASQRGLGQQVQTEGDVPSRPAQGLTVTLAGRRSLRIVNAEVVAHALSGKSRSLLTSKSPKSDVTRTFQLMTKGDRGFSANLWMEGVTSIRWIEVKSLTYSDGSVWHESETERCSVRPDPFVLISSAR